MEINLHNFLFGIMHSSTPFSQEGHRVTLITKCSGPCDPQAGCPAFYHLVHILPPVYVSNNQKKASLKSTK